MTEEKVTYRSQSEKILFINNWFKILLISAIAGTILYKIIVSSFDLSAFDFSDLLSLILAIFSIGLSVMFYIKADETSNRFYDNTNKFTQDVSTILGRIEAGFGERLRHIDEGYNKFEDYYINTKPGEIEKQRIKSNQQEVKKVEEEKDKIIQDLLQKTQLQDAEKQEIIRNFRKNDMELEKTRHELFRLQNLFEKVNTNDDREVLRTRALNYFVKAILIPNNRLRGTKSASDFRNRFNDLSCSFNPDWIEDLIKLKWLDKNRILTREGAENLYLYMEQIH